MCLLIVNPLDFFLGSDLCIYLYNTCRYQYWFIGAITYYAYVSLDLLALYQKS